MRRALAAAALAAVLGAGCRKASGPAPAGAAARLPKGDVIWLADPGAASDPALEPELERLGAAAVFLPAGTLRSGAGEEAFEAAPGPSKPFERVPVVLVFRPDEALASAFADTEGPDPASVSSAAAQAATRAISSAAYGRVLGVHLDVPVSPRSAARSAALVGALRRGLPAGTFVSISLRSLPAGADDRKRLIPLFEGADALVAFVFGTGAHMDGIAADALRRPWWAAYDTRASGRILGASGEARGPVAGRYVELLSGNPRLQFENDLSVNDGSVSAFTLTARAPVRQEGLSLEPGDRIAFRLPAISEMLFQLGSNLAGKRYALGRALIFEGATEGDRLFSLAAMEDVLLGRSLAPGLEASVKPAGRSAIAVDLVNRTHHASVASRVDNWVDVDVAPAHPADVQLGGFDRYEVYDRAGNPVTPGRATTVRLFETIVAPMETVTPARIVVRGGLPAGCCRYRLHAVSAAGPEVSSEWSAPPAPTAPEPRSKKPAASRKAR